MHRGCPCCLYPGPGEIRAEDIVVDCKVIYKGGGEGLDSGLVGLHTKAVPAGECLSLGSG